jgi:hypothetical protein
VTRRALGLLLAGTFFFGLMSVPKAKAACEPLDVGPPGCVQVSEWSTVVDGSRLTYYRLPATALFVDPGEHQWAAKFVPYCEGNVAGTIFIDDGLCIRALVTCGLRGSDAVLALWMRLVPIFGGPARMEGPVCFSGSSKTELGPLIQAQAEQAIGPAPPPTRLQPADAIINLPSIASTEPRGTITLEINEPVRGTLRATPSYVWDFGDGSGGHGPGIPYDGTSPVSDPGHYVAHAYRALGTPTVTLTVTWSVTFTIPGYLPIPMRPVVRDASMTTTIREASSQLIGG